MSTTARWSVVLACLLAAMSGVARASTQEQIGSWVLSCPGDNPKSGACLLRASKRFLDKAGLTGDLEIEAQGHTLVPVIALRGLSKEMLTAAAMIGKTEVTLQFPGGDREDLACAASAAGYICAPNDAAGQKLAAALPVARSVTARVAVTVTGLKPLPAQEKTLDLSGTNEALSRLRAVGPTQVPPPMTALASQSPATLIGMADKALKAAGYPNGAAELQALMGKYMKKSGE
jgi:hypothetical protein